MIVSQDVSNAGRSGTVEVLDSIRAGIRKISQTTSTGTRENPVPNRLDLEDGFGSNGTQPKLLVDAVPRTTLRVVATQTRENFSIRTDPNEDINSNGTEPNEIVEAIPQTVSVLPLSSRAEPNPIIEDTPHVVARTQWDNLSSSVQAANFPIDIFNQSLSARDHGDREVSLNVADIAAASIPNVQEMNVSDNSTVGFGPQFHSIERTIYTEDVLKARVLGVDLTSPKKSNNVRCSVLVFVIFSLIVGSGMIHHYVKYGIVHKPNPIVDIDISERWYIRRADWQAISAFKTNFLRLPVRYVIVGHSETESCIGQASCIEEIQRMQIHDQLFNKLDDIAPNFIVTSEGLIFEARGINIEGEMVQLFDFNSITIKFLGDYRTNRTIVEQLQNMSNLLRELVRVGVLRHDYDLVGHCQIDRRVDSPGINLFSELTNFQRWWPHNVEFCFSWSGWPTLPFIELSPDRNLIKS